jgi:hypothetical protein
MNNETFIKIGSTGIECLDCRMTMCKIHPQSVIDLIAKMGGDPADRMIEINGQVYRFAKNPDCGTHWKRFKEFVVSEKI